MAREIRRGRPRASSRETLAEAACELFLEQGYEATSVSDITARAGVSRSSFFNYFAAKQDVLWAGFDDRLDVFADEIAAGGEVRAALARIPHGFRPDALALAYADPAAMGITEHLEREAARRSTRIAAVISTALVGGGTTVLNADVVAAAYAGAVLAAVRRWAHEGSGRTDLGALVVEALGYVDEVTGATRD